MLGLSSARARSRIGRTEAQLSSRRRCRAAASARCRPATQIGATRTQARPPCPQDGWQAMPSRAAARDQRGGRPQGGHMSIPSTRTLAALAFERGEESDPALTPPSAPLAEELVLLAGAPGHDARAVADEATPAARARAPRCVRGRAERDVARQPATEGAEVMRR